MTFGPLLVSVFMTHGDFNAKAKIPTSGLEPEVANLVRMLALLAVEDFLAEASQQPNLREDHDDK